MGFAEETVQIRVRVLHVSECRVQKRVVYMLISAVLKHV